MRTVSQDDIIDITVRKPQATSDRKKRKINGKSENIIGHIGTRMEHYLQYLSNVMDTLDKNKMKGYYIVMDNAPINMPIFVSNLVEKRRCKSLFLPPYSPFLSPIREFQSKIKAGVRRTPLRVDDNLTDRIHKSVTRVRKSDCDGQIRQLLSFFERCFNEERNF